MPEPNKMTNQSQTESSVKGSKNKAGWWSTNCPFCKRMRLYVIWTILMFVVYFYAFQR